MAQIICSSCQQKAKHHGRGLCAPCYHAKYRSVHVMYFQQYRSRPEYQEQRQQYDTAYLLRVSKKQTDSQSPS